MESIWLLITIWSENVSFKKAVTPCSRSEVKHAIEFLHMKPCSHKLLHLSGWAKNILAKVGQRSTVFMVMPPKIN